MKKLIHILSLALGLLLALAPFILFPVCELMPGGNPMRCWYSALLIQGLGSAIGILSLMGLWRRLSSVVHVAVAVAALMCWLVPHQIVRVDGWPFGLCGNPEHACRAVTMPAVGLLVAAVVTLSVLGLILNFVKGAPSRATTR